MPASEAPPLRLYPVLAELPTLLSYIDGFAGEHALPPADAHALALVAEELFANTVNHGHSAPGAASVHCGLSLDGSALTLVYSDAALPFDPTTAVIPAIPDASTPAERRPVGGLGIHLVRKLMHTIDYVRQDGRNFLTLTRRIGANRLAQNQP
ncbi:MAG TPA: ATP-binding protein [Terracidiphilus sp.]|nr:ATP-binding protein [Terracidiphilus sp.]